MRSRSAERSLTFGINLQDTGSAFPCILPGMRGVIPSRPSASRSGAGTRQLSIPLPFFWEAPLWVLSRFFYPVRTGRRLWLWSRVGTSGEALSLLMLESLTLCHRVLLGLPGSGSSSGQPRIPAAAPSEPRECGTSVAAAGRSGAARGTGMCVGRGCGFSVCPRSVGFREGGPAGECPWGGHNPGVG